MEPGFRTLPTVPLSLLEEEQTWDFHLAVSYLCGLLAPVSSGRCRDAYVKGPKEWRTVKTLCKLSSSKELFSSLIQYAEFDARKSGWPARKRGENRIQSPFSPVLLQLPLPLFMPPSSTAPFPRLGDPRRP